VRLPHLLWPLAAATALLLAIAGRLRRRERLGAIAAVASTGFAGMIFDLALIFAFQALYGVVFFWVGLLVTAFMAGSAVGGLAGTRLVGRLRGTRGWFLGVEAALAVFAGALPLAVRALGGSEGFDGAAVQSLFLALSLAAGALIGLEFPLACRLHLGAARGAGTTAGSLYAADLVGGWAGGILGGVLLLPLLGLGATCLAVALLKLASLAVAARTLPRAETSAGGGGKSLRPLRAKEG
jgi:spermidine synthase